ncbi:hypothetical protein LC608_34040 [Nostoc sp. XA010]|uniref:hypothetical protein n=1 Tax=Nostoc sp. XA010 TaxID=2780407 RepID=UPI001E42E3C7|nr:hypothetical protein [Nostoc sp. XA010]MCC5661877.1 hypothetical protein [Nostoc sp. XA010]
MNSIALHIHAVSGVNFAILGVCMVLAVETLPSVCCRRLWGVWRGAIAQYLMS